MTAPAEVCCMSPKPWRRRRRSAGRPRRREPMADLRFRTVPLPIGYVPPAAAARYMGLTPEAFARALPELLQRGFPAADQTTGNFHLDAIDAWSKSLNPQLFGLTPAIRARDARDVVGDRLARLRGG
jgi:hypothetical protein